MHSILCGNDLDLKQHERQWFRLYGKVKPHFLVNILDPNEKYELMYRAPNRAEHQNITEILDEIINRLDKIETQLQNLNKTN